MITTLLALSLTTAVAPQEPLSGVFMNAPVVLTGSGASLDPKQILFANASAGAIEFGAIDPRFTRQAIFHGLGAGLDIGSFSSGKAFITAHWSGGRGCADIGGNHWSFIVYSVTSTTRGSLGSLYQADANHGVGANIYSYIMPGSDLPSGVGQVCKMRDAGQMGLTEVRGVDSYLNALLLGGVPWTGINLYFTVTLATINQIPQEWKILPADQRPSTIFRVSFDGQNWGMPVVFRNHVDLGIGEFEEIDALSLDDFRDVILLSTTEPDLNKQLWLVWPLHNYRGAYYDKLGVQPYVRTNLGFIDPLNDGIDGLCADDPLRDEQAQDDRHRWRIRLNGMPVDSDLVANLNLRYGLHRESRNDNKEERYRMTLTHHCAPKSPTDQFAGAFVRMGKEGALVGLYMRNNSNPVDTITHLAPCPNTPSTLGVNLQFYWQVSSSTGVSSTFIHEVYR
ncbi:MAG: hypothetical protein KDC87_02210 [Planctomycetes bacterium]|nr:hypothetical protein [Planctomycetota bacterium]MCB9872195.1 hypothetical protein [Planctomycetota bacterium]